MKRFFKAFFPFIAFVVLFLGSGIYYHFQGIEFSFYQIPGPVAAIPAILFSLFLASGKLEDRLTVFMNGMGNSNILTMCLIYLLAGSFAVLMTSSGGVETAVQLGLHYIPAGFIIPGIFILSSVISFAMGTSMGTISAIGPIAFGLVESANINSIDIFGALVGGAMFGDNLSFISDTTIAATKTQGAHMRDKFIANFKLALPAALITVIYLSTLKIPPVPVETQTFVLPKLIPYALLLISALMGMNVFFVLILGIVSAAVTSFFYIPDYDAAKLSQHIFQGFKDMHEIFLLSMFMGGLGEMLKAAGGLDILRGLFAQKNKSDILKSEIAIASSVIAANVAVANNTVAILVCGEFAKEVAEREGIAAARSASLLDVFSCIIQGLLPYGAQILLASQLGKVSPLALAGKVYYCYFLSAITILSFIKLTKR